jgi:hypothetical protein
MAGLTAVFAELPDARETAKSSEAEVENLRARVGQMLVERDFLPKPPFEERGQQEGVD